MSLHLYCLDFSLLTKTALDANQIWVDLRHYAISAFTTLYQALAAHNKHRHTHTHTPTVIQYISHSHDV